MNDYNDSNPQQNNFQSSNYPELPAHQETSVKKSKPRKSFSQNISNFFRNIGILVVILIVAASTVFAFVLINPDSRESKWIVERTNLSNYYSFFGLNKNKEEKKDTKAETTAAVPTTTETKIDYNRDFNFATGSNSRTTTSIVKDSLPSVLSISVKSTTSRLAGSSVVAGTGFIVSEDGLVVSNKHVIAQECQNPKDIQISALSHDQKAYDLELLSVDPIDDIAILRIKNNAEKLSAVKFADSNAVPLGADVIAIGNVLGELENSVTKGIISGLNRSIDASNQSLSDECTGQRVVSIDALIQTDAAINPGNSGGPLFDSAGLLVGMNTLGSKEGQGIGLAISSNTILVSLKSYEKNGKIIRPRLGVYTETVTPLQKQQNTWLPVDYGEIILSPTKNEKAVAVGSPAEKAGLVDGDVIVELNGVKLVASEQNVSPLKRSILSKQSDEEVELTVYKATKETSVGYEYKSQPTIIKVKLGGVSYDLKK